MASAVGDANSGVEFVFPTSKEMGHPNGHGRCSRTGIATVNCKAAWLSTCVVFAGSWCACDEPGDADRAAGDVALSVRKEVGTGQVRFISELSAESISTLDALHYRLTLRIGPGYEAEFPDIYTDEHLAGFIVTRQQDRDETDADGTRRVIRDYDLEPEFTGQLTLGAIHVYFYPADDIREEELVTEPIEITVAGEDLAADARQLRGVRGLVTVDEYAAQNRRRWPWVVGISLAGLGAIGAGVWFVRRPRPGPPPPPPHQVAMEALRALVARDLVAHGEIEPFFVHLTGIVREYIENAFGVRAPEQTTEEFLQHVVDAPSVAAHRAALEPFLQTADAVKFARFTPDAAMIQRAFDTARDFILQTSAGSESAHATDRREQAA